MNLKIEKIEINNFLSIGKAEVDFQNRGFVKVTGINRCAEDGAKSNGVGKSTIFDAVLWGFTGETIRGTKDVCNMYTNDGALVRIEFSLDGVSYSILRAKDNSEYKSGIRLYKDGKDISGKGIRETTEIIENTLDGISGDILRSVVIFGQGLPDRLSNNTPSGRKAVLEKLSKSDYMIDDLKHRISDRLKQVKQDLRNDEDRILEYTTRINADEEAIEQIKKQIENHPSVEESQKRIEEYKKELDEIVPQRDELKAKCDNLEAQVIVKRNDYKSLSSTMALENAQTREKFQGYKHTKETLIVQWRERRTVSEGNIKKAKAVIDVCPYCHQKIEGVFKPDIKEDERIITECDDKIQELRNEITDIEQQEAEAVETVQNKYHDKQVSLVEDGKRTAEELANTKRVYQELETRIEKLSNDIQAEQKLIDCNAMILSMLIERLGAVSADKDTYTTKKTYMEVDRDKDQRRVDAVSAFNTAVSRDFRGYLLIGVIQFIQESASKYATKLFGTSNIEFKQSGNNLEIGYNGRTYENLSGGEKQKVDIAMQLAVRDMLCKYLNFSCNIIALDEITDNLDDLGCNSVMQLITDDLKDVESVFVISHRADSLSIPYDKELTVIKAENGVSSIFG